MRVPTVETRPSGAAPWGGAPGSEWTRLETSESPLVQTVIRGTLLTLVTLGIYRFWYKARLRRYYWSNTTLGGDGFEYTGTGKELFIGFLIALAVIVPLQIALSVAGAFIAEDSVGGLVISLAILLVVPALVQFALFRARRYRLSRTRFRGIRFQQRGSAVEYLIITAQWLFLTVLTLGIMLPYLRTALQRYRIDNTWFGSQQASFEAKAGPLFGRWMLVWGGGAGVVILFGLALFGAFTRGSLGNPLFEILLALGLLLGLPFLWVYYRAAEFQHFTGGTRFGDIYLASDVSAGSMIWIYVRYGLLVIGALLAVGLIVGVFGGLTRTLSFGPGSEPGLALIVASSISGLAAIVALGVLAELYLRRPLWKLFARSVAIANVSALAEIIQNSVAETTAFGEAFDSGYDIAG